jgi:hypothetical protein
MDYWDFAGLQETLEELFPDGNPSHSGLSYIQISMCHLCLCGSKSTAHKVVSSGDITSYRLSVSPAQLQREAQLS